MPRVVAAVISSGVSPTTMSRAAVRKYKTPAAIGTSAAYSRWARFTKIDMIECRRSQLDHLSRMNVFARPNLFEQLFARNVVEIQNRERGAAGLVSTQGHGRDVYLMFPKQSSDASDNSGPI